MSETRSYFSYRYAVSGFLFIMIVFLVNLDLIPRILKGSETINLSAVIAIVTFFSGPSIGFILAQFWYNIFDYLGVRRWFWKKGIEALKEDKILDSNTCKTDLWVIKTDFSVFYGKKEKDADKFGKKGFDYLVRRWDLFNSLSITAFSMFLGLVVGYAARGFLRNYCMELLNNNLMPSDQVILLSVYQWFIILVSFASISSLILGALRVRNEHQNMILYTLQKEKLLHQGTTMNKYFYMSFFGVISSASFLSLILNNLEFGLIGGFMDLFNLIRIISILIGLIGLIVLLTTFLVKRLSIDRIE